MEFFVRFVETSHFSITKNEKLTQIQQDFSLPISSEIQTQFMSFGFNDYLLSFYSFSNGCKISWVSEENPNLSGSLNLIEMNWILQDQSEIFYIEDFDKRLENFRPVDQFVPEASCGIIMNGSGDNRMYYHDAGDSKLFSLDIDFKSYLELGLEAKFFLYWQRYLVELVHGPIGFQVLFKTGMKEVFPDFDLDAFTKKFQELRLNLD